MKTPTTKEVREHWATWFGEFGGDDEIDAERAAAFDHWLAEVKQQAVREATLEAAEDLDPSSVRDIQPPAVDPQS